ncbi:uncharacterized protein LOC133797180 [Humulus lupulus]|uniref:uncharacterized protein LOC133797180 n=1 Tax=Humulus lupulus TaxID=3486 RepID=UPI002B412CF4|nr:uncharacterized protein LOC133797180 [Humulus lupulus]XP_062090987.1 uncharacterized protein LOC133797180 [Humulus lupulus]
MALNLVQPGGSSNPKNLSPLNEESCNLKISQLIQMLLAELGKESTQSCKLVQEFYELMQTRVDPPLESIWVYAAVAFRSHFNPKGDLFDRIAAAKGLFQLISACSSSCSSSKSVILLAPVVYEVYKVAVELFEKDLACKREKKMLKEVKSLVEAILGYINVCCSGAVVEKGDLDGSNLVRPFSDLVRIWMNSNVGLEFFLPLATGEVLQKLREGGEFGYLAGIVIAEAFLLKLWLNVKIGKSREDLEKELRTWAVGSITGFHNFYFFDTLVRMLLEKTLPLAFLPNSKDEVLLRQVLYDAVILADYSFLNPEKLIHLPADRVKSLALARLIVTCEAVEFFREQGNRKRSVSYINAFCNSSLSSQINKWIKNQIQVVENDSKLHGSSPKALFKCLMKLEDQGVIVFGDSVLKDRAELLRDTFKTELQQPASKMEGKKRDDDDDDLLFYEDKEGEELDENDDDENSNEAVTAAFVAAARSMKSNDNEDRKRKNNKSSEKKKKIKFLKYEPLQSSESPIRRSPAVNYDSASSGSEVENPLSDSE